jgi:hypothetical protein
MSQTVTQTPGQRRADQLARIALLTLVISVAFGLIYGALDALIYPYVSFVQAVNGPVFQLVTLAYFLAMLLGVPGLLVGIRDGLRGQWGQAGRVLAFVGPLIIFFGVSGLSHLLIPCQTDPPVWPANTFTPWLCTAGSIKGQFHLLHHTLTMGVILLVLYWFALRKWYPSVTRFRRGEGAEEKAPR